MYQDGKPYHSLNSYYQKKFGHKTVKLPLDGGFNCPNRDGKIATGGCIFCSAKGSGDFTPSRYLSITEQLQISKEKLLHKWQNPKYIAYFQAFTNTYAPVSVLRTKYEEALSDPEIIGLSIATRPDCLDDDVLELLEELTHKTSLCVELGLQTSNQDTAKAIHRGYENMVFEKAVHDLKERKIEVVVHVILGLPNETKEDMRNTISYLNALPIDGIKLQLLHVLKDTPLAESYQNGDFTVLSKDAYIDILCSCIALLRPDIVIHRMTGDGPKESLLAPLWSLQKRDVLNSIHKELKLRNISQGMNFKV